MRRENFNASAGWKFQGTAVPYGTDCNASMIYLHRWSCNNLAITFFVQSKCHNTGARTCICSCELKTQAMYDILWLLGSCYDTLWTLHILWLIAIRTQAMKPRFETTWATSSWLITLRKKPFCCQREWIICSFAWEFKWPGKHECTKSHIIPVCLRHHVCSTVQ